MKIFISETFLVFNFQALALFSKELGVFVPNQNAKELFPFVQSFEGVLDKPVSNSYFCSFFFSIAKTQVFSFRGFP